MLCLDTHSYELKHVARSRVQESRKIEAYSLKLHLMETLNFWVLARCGEHRYGRAEEELATVHRGRALPANLLWTATVQHNLRSCTSALVCQRTPEGQSPSAWGEAFKDLHCRAVGYVTLRPAVIAHEFLPLSKALRLMKDFWFMTIYHGSPLVCCDVDVAFCFDAPVRVQSLGEDLGRNSRKWSFELTPASRSELERLCHASGWTPPCRTPRCLVLPCPHALLVVSLQWPQCALPAYFASSAKTVASRRRKSTPLLNSWWHGSASVSAMLKALPEPDVQARDGHLDSLAKLESSFKLSPDSLLDYADAFRWLLNPSATPTMYGRSSAEHLEDIKTKVRMLDAARSQLLLEEARLGRRVHNMDKLLRCLLVVGFLKNAQGLVETLHHALDLLLPQGQATYLHELLAMEHALPSTTTIWRTRLMLVAGYLNLHADLEASRLGGFHEPLVTWSTLDSSPQAGYEWVMRGTAVMLEADLPQAYLHSQDLELSLWGLCLCMNHGLGSRQENVCLVGQEKGLSQNTPVKLVAGESHTAIMHSFSLESCMPQALLARAPGFEEHVEYLAPRILLRPGVPTSVGSAKATVAHKAKAMLHSERLSSRSWSEALQKTNASFSRTGDLGAERALSGFRASLPDMFGEWIRSFTPNPSGFQVQDMQQAPQPHQPPSSEGLDLQGEIFVPGMLHILDNLSHDLERCLTGWESFTTQLKHCCLLLKHPASRDRLFQTCLAVPPWSSMRSKLEGFTGHVYKQRWGSTLQSIQQITPLLPILVGAWDLERFGVRDSGRAEESQARGHAVLSVQIVDQALTGGLFQGYALGMLAIADLLQHISAWCEACPCFSKSDVAAFDSQDLEVLQLHKKQCPLRTRRAPELAAGKMEEFLTQVAHVTAARLLTEPKIMSLQASDRDLIFTDVAAAKQRILLVLQLKLSFWQQLPHAIFTLGHVDPSVVASGAARVLLLHDQQMSGSDHPVVKKLCADDGELRLQLEACANGRPLQEHI